MEAKKSFQPQRRVKPLGRGRFGFDESFRSAAVTFDLSVVETAENGLSPQGL